MDVLEVQVTKEGVLIPREYLQPADEFEAVVQNGDVLVRPKNATKDTNQEQKSWLHDLIGIAETKDPTASERVEEILTEEVTRRSGWTTKPSMAERLNISRILTVDQRDFRMVRPRHIPAFEILP